MGRAVRINFVTLLAGQDGKQWLDGMYAAHKRLISDYNYDIHYYLPSDNFMEGDPDILAAWGGANSKEVVAVSKTEHPRKVLFHAGGDFNSGALQQFKLLFVEWPNEEHTLRAKGFSYEIAFGTNEELFYPRPMPRLWDAVYPCAYADWKRHKLFADAVGSAGLTCGQKQKIEQYCFTYPEEKGCLVLPQMPMEILPYIYSASYTVAVTASYYGGSQRTILEGMACGIPAIVMRDAGRNLVYVEESGVGSVVDPEPEQVRDAVEKWKRESEAKGTALTLAARNYVLTHWTSRHYASAIDKGLRRL